jgi:hypothetical protein
VTIIAIASCVASIRGARKPKQHARQPIADQGGFTDVGMSRSGSALICFVFQKTTASPARPTSILDTFPFPLIYDNNNK